MSAGGHEQALDLVRHEIGDAAAVRRHDAAAAGKRLDDDAAEPLRPGRQHEHRRGVELRRDGLRLEPLVVLDAAGEVRHERVDHRLLRAAADDHEPRPSGSRSATSRHAAASPSTFLYASSAPTKSDGRSLRQRNRRLAR